MNRASRIVCQNHLSQVEAALRTTSCCPLDCLRTVRLLLFPSSPVRWLILLQPCNAFLPSPKPNLNGSSAITAWRVLSARAGLITSGISAPRPTFSVTTAGTIQKARSRVSTTPMVPAIRCRALECISDIARMRPATPRRRPSSGMLSSHKWRNRVAKATARGLCLSKQR